MRLATVYEDQVFDALPNLHNFLPTLVHFASQVDNDLLDELWRRKPIVKVIVEEECESVNYITEYFVH